ncbi:hypothetical protein J6G99_04560 [bacterium]|nr:hypothetical protein [bacterium]
MTKLIPLNYGQYINATPEQKARHQEKAQEVAAGTGVAGAASYQAKRYATKQTLNGMFTKVTEASKIAHQNTKVASGLWGKFKYDIGRFSTSIMNQVAKFENMKIIGPIIKSPIMKGTANCFGIGMAFFALVTGLDKAYRNGKFAVLDLKEKMGLVA